MPKKTFPYSGYTLIELLIVIAIIAIISMTSFVYFNNFGVSQGVDRNVLIIQNAIEIAQTNASTGLKCRSSSGTPSDSIGWIVEFRDPRTLNLICKSTSAEVIVKSYSLDIKASIDSISPLSACTSSEITPADTNPIAIFYGSNPRNNKFIFARGVVGGIECQDAKNINIKVNYDGDTNYKTFGLNLSGAINEVAE